MYTFNVNGNRDEKLKCEEDERRSQMIRILLANCLCEAGFVNSQVLPCYAELFAQANFVECCRTKTRVVWCTVPQSR